MPRPYPKSVGGGRFLLREPGQRGVLGVEFVRRAHRLIVFLGRAVLGGRGVLGDLGVPHALHLPMRCLRRPESGGSSTATSSRSVCTPRMKVVLAPAPKAIASTA